MIARSKTHRPFVVRACAAAIVAVLGVGGAASAQAENLMDVYRQALHADPTLMQAEAQKRIGHEGAVQSRSVLLPQINGSVSYNGDHGSSTSSQLATIAGGGTASFDSFGHSEGRSRTESVGLNQVLFDLGKFAQMRASNASAAAASSEYVSAQQDLILRVATAYFTVLTDEDQLKYAKSNQASLKKQLDQAQAKYDVGFAPITDVADAQAQYDNAIASVISAQNTVQNDREALSEITGQPVGNLETLTDKIPLNAPAPANPDAWVKTALASNPALEAQRDQVRASQHSVTAARAGHLPTIDASVNYSRTPSWGDDAINPSGLPAGVVDVLRGNQRRTSTSIGFTLSVPLFAGGGTQSRVRQSIAQRDQANAVLVQDRRQAVANTRNAYNSITAGISSVEAQKQAVVSTKTALDATQAGYDIGTQNIVNLLIAQSNYFNALSAYSQARHALVINRLNLKYAAGTLSVNDLQAVNTLLQ